MVTKHQPCSLYPRTHYPPPPLATTEAHHPWPKYLGGPDHGQDMAWLCGNCHNSVHLAITALVEGEPIPRGVTPRQRELAQRGYDAWLAAGKPAPHAAIHAGWVAKLAA